MMLRAMPIFAVLIAFLAGRYHVLWTDSAWVLVPIFAMPVFLALAGITSMEIDYLQKQKSNKP